MVIFKHLIKLEDFEVWSLHFEAKITDDMFVCYMLIWKNVFHVREKGWEQYAIGIERIKNFDSVYKSWKENLWNDKDFVVLMKLYYPEMFVRTNNGVL